jgi:hypothetical protein
MQLKEIVQVTDAGAALLRNRAGAVIADRKWDSKLEISEKPIIQVEGWVQAVMRERGKIVPGTRREGKNIWTNTGREFLAMLMSLQAGSTPFRTDSVALIGVGTGSQVESGGVIKLVTPVAYSGTNFLAALDIPPTFPLSPSRTTVRYSRTFLQNELTLTSGSQVDISELGLFTNGSPSASPPYTPGTRDITLANAAAQAPVAYKTFEPVTKTDVLEFEVSWEIRF